jgi:hypothetical protein
MGSYIHTAEVEEAAGQFLGGIDCTEDLKASDKEGRGREESSSHGK